MSKARLVMDSNIPGKIKSTNKADQVRIETTIANSYAVATSPNTLIEFINGVLNSASDTYLSEDQDKLRTLVGSGALDVLAFPGDFALRRIGIVSSEPMLGPKRFEKWIKAILRARSHRAVVEGLKADANRITKIHDAGRAHHQKLLSTETDGARGAFPSIDGWITSFASNMKVTLSTRQRQLLRHGLDSAYQYRKESAKRALSGGKAYNVSKHDGDWWDWQQLFYLADPTIHLLTDDAGIKQKCESSPQSNRILLLKTF